MGWLSLAAVLLAASPAPEAGGTHWRLESRAGPVHVWHPAGFAPRSAATVVYLHGYYTGVDEAWARHGLAEQFRHSGRNALFIAPEAPASAAEGVFWTDPAALLWAVREGTGLEIPKERLLVLAHSGAYRTVATWLGSGLLGEVILLDALYGEHQAFAGWVGGDQRLVLVASTTARRTEQFLSRVATQVVRAALPLDDSGFDERARRAPLLYLRSNEGHMELVTGGRVIPLLLRLSGIRAV
ncbi:MAG: hypothetical protein ACYC8T_08300 [Myxococcaceae bacterium]